MNKTITRSTNRITPEHLTQFLEKAPCKALSDPPRFYKYLCDRINTHFADSFDKLESALAGASWLLRQHIDKQFTQDEEFSITLPERKWPNQTLTSGTRTYKLTLQGPSPEPLDPAWVYKTETITARSITAAIALLYEQHPEYSGVYRVVGVEEVPEIKFQSPVRHNVAPTQWGTPSAAWIAANQKVDEVPSGEPQTWEVKDAQGETVACGVGSFPASTKPNDFDIPLTHDAVTINGAKIIGPALIDILNMVTQPNPRRWYRFERQGELITVHTKQDEESK